MSGSSAVHPYAATVRVGTDEADPADVVCRLLEAIGAGAERAGASVIGHIKARVRASGGDVYCSLTSTRAGARRRAGTAREAAEVDQQGSRAGAAADSGVQRDVADGARADLVVLVYGLSYGQVRDVVSNAVDAMRQEGVGVAIAPTTPEGEG